MQAVEPFQGGKPQARRVTGSGTKYTSCMGKQWVRGDLRVTLLWDSAWEKLNQMCLGEIKSNVQATTAGLPWATWPASKQHGHTLLCSITDGERYVKNGFSSKIKVPFILFVTAATPYQDIPHTAIYGTMSSVETVLSHTSANSKWECNGMGN